MINITECRDVCIRKIRWMKDITLEELLNDEEYNRLMISIDEVLKEKKWGCYAV